MKQGKQISAVKAAAKRMVVRARQMAMPLALSQALELLASEAGHENWHVYSAALQEADTALKPWKRSMGWMTCGQYLTHKEPNCCPRCGHDQVEGDSVEINGRFARQKVWCTECESSWDDVYTLSHYEATDDGLDDGATQQSDAVPATRVAPNRVTLEAELRDCWEATGKGAFEDYVDELSNANDNPMQQAAQQYLVWRERVEPAASGRSVAAGNRFGKVYNVAMYDLAGGFITKREVVTDSEETAIEDTRRACARDTAREELTFYVEYVGELEVTQATLESWLKRCRTDESDLDELVHESVQQKGLPAVNSADDEAEQDALIGDAEAAAARINNGGLSAQVEYLLQVFTDPVGLVKYLMDELDIHVLPAVK